MDSSSRLRALSAFLPGTLVRALAEEGSRPHEGARTECQGAVLFADLSGFTALAEALDRTGPSGAERLTGILDACFAQLIEAVVRHGGDILRFAGDGLLALWVAESEQDIAHVVHLAAQCSQEAQDIVTRLEAPVEGLRLRIRMGLGAGPVRLSDVGGEQDRWEFLASGPPLLEMAQAEHEAKPGEIVLGPNAWAFLEAAGAAEGEPLPSGCWRLKRLEPRPLPIVERPRALPHMEPALRAYLPPVVLHRLDAGHSQWLSEFRHVSVVFINLDSRELASGERPEDLQRAYRAIQAALFRYEGTSNQVVVDDKGIICVAAFGLPPQSHEDDAARAVQAALDIHGALTAQGVKHRLGITSGRVFCGAYGGQSRREYVTISHTVNLAARLMQEAEDEVLCDSATMRLAGSRLHFKTLTPIRMRGTSQAMAVFRALAEAPESRFSPAPLSTRMVGRAEERTHLATCVQALAEDGRGGLILIEGEAGIGKSVLVGELLMQAGASGLAFAMGAGNAVERSSAYHAWRPILSRLLGLEGLPDTATRTALLLERLEALPGRLAWAPLLNGVLPVEVPDTDVVRHMPGALRGSNTRELLVQLIEECCRLRPCVVVLEDVHWLDSSSWELAASVHHRAALLLALTTRPVAEQHAPEEYRLFRAASGTVYLPLERMPPDDVVAMMCQRFNVRHLPPEVTTLIRDKAEGHPFFSEQLICALRDAGHLVLEEGEYRLVAQSATLAALDLPDTIQGVLNSRLDRLTAQQQLTLKVASVLGRSFSFEVLLAVHPLAQDRATLPEQMEALSRLGFLVLESAKPLVYAFKHALVQEAAYGLLAFSQRRELHRAVALHMEDDWEAQRESLLPVLAHHWRQAEAPAQAVGYLERAAEAALTRGANHEAITFLSQAQELAAIHPGTVTVDTLRRIRWHIRLGEAHHRLVEMEPSRTHLHKALRLLGHSLPSSRRGWGARLGWELLRQVAVLSLRRWRPLPGPEQRERLALSAHVTSLLAEQQLYMQSLLEGICLSLLSVNLAEVAHVYEPASIGYNGLGYMVGVARLHRLARLYFRRAQSTTEANRGAMALLTEGSYHMTFGRWDKGLALQEQSLELARGVNDRESLGLARELLGMGLEFSRQPAEAQRVRETMLAVARAGSNPRHELWALTEMVTTLVLLGRLDEAQARLREAEELQPRVDDSLSAMRFRGYAAWGFLLAGDRTRAELHAREMLRILRGKPQLLWPDITPLGGLAETWQALWSEARRTGQGDARELQANATYTCRVLRQLTRLYPIAHPRADRLEGTQAWLEGRTDRACKLWRRALHHAHTYGMPLEEALAHRALALHAPEPSARATHLAQAHHLFQTLGVSERFHTPMGHEEPQAAA